MGVPPDEARLRDLLAPLTDALAVIHAEQCFHRDIAPDNVILLHGSDRPLLLDFGAARRVIGDMTQALTVILQARLRAGRAVRRGARHEAGRRGPTSTRSPAVVYYAITGKTPPTSVGRLMNDNYVPMTQVGAGRYSPSFLAAIDRALVVKPERTHAVDRRPAPRPRHGTERHRLRQGRGEAAGRRPWPAALPAGAAARRDEPHRSLRRHRCGARARRRRWPLASRFRASGRRPRRRPPPTPPVAAAGHRPPPRRPDVEPRRRW